MFDCLLEAGEGLAPEGVEVRPQLRDAARLDPVDAAVPVASFADEARVLEHPRTLAALPPEEPEPELEPESETVVYDLPPGSSPILHCAPPPIFAPATATEPAAEPLPEPGLYLFQGEKGPMIPLVRHAADDGAQAHILYSHEAAVDLLRVFGGDPRFLDTIHDADPQPNTP